MKKTLIILSMLLGICTGRAQKSFIPHTWGDWQTWGDQHDGHYLNPVIPADYSDIDCIEHDGYYYAISSTFQFEPGMVILRSTDMVNWHVYSHAVPDVSQIVDDKGSGKAMTWQGMDRYAKGIWAGAIRWHKGRFYVYFGCPDEGMFMTTAKKIEGPWAPLTKMKAEGHDGVNFKGGWDDCCPLFEAPSPALFQGGSYDVKKYPYFFVATHYADGYKTYVFPLSADGKTVDWDHKVLINEGYGREASKLYKWMVDIDGQKVTKYYHMFSEDRDGGRYLVMQRADHPMGPYTERHRLHHTEREWNEPNQGGYLQDAEGKWFFLTHHGHGDWGGREVSLLPVTWTKDTGNAAEDGWPIIGEPDKDNVGKMVWRNKMPVAKRSEKIKVKGEKLETKKKELLVSGFLAEDWEWNYHPRKGFYKRTEKALTLKAFKPLRENDLMKAGNTLTLRSYQTPSNWMTVRIDLSKMAEGQRTGICHFSWAWSEFGVKMEGGRRILYHRSNEGGEEILKEGVPETIELVNLWGLDGRCRYGITFPNSHAVEFFEGRYYLQWGNYRGDRLGLYTYNNIKEAGEATFTHFFYSTDDKPVSGWEPKPFGNSLLPDMIADASIQRIGDTFYCYATTDGYGRGLDTSGPAVVWKSKDFVHWSFDGGILPQYESEKFWAPSKAVQANGKWYLYPTINGYMYPLVADSPEGPFSIAKGNTFTTPNRLWEKDNVHAIDTEIFVDDDGTPYAFWGSRHVVRLKPDMVTVDTTFTPAPSTGAKQEAPGVYTIPTRRTEYSEGPIFFKRKGIYYYLYTIGGDERYEYYYQMSRVSPLGPWETPQHDLVCTTNVEKGVFGPGHGSVFVVPSLRQDSGLAHNDNIDDNDSQYYLAFLEFGRRSTNRMTYVNKLNFNADGTIQQVEVNLEGVRYLRPDDHPRKVFTANSSITASTTAQAHLIRENKDWRCRRTEMFLPHFSIDGANGSRWMADEKDTRPWLCIDLGEARQIGSSEIAFSRPTAGHAYILEGSLDGQTWQKVGGHADVQKRSPHVDKLNANFRYLRLSITAGEKGVYEWNVYE